MDDITTYALLTASFFFVALALALMVRYRQVSQRINTSTDLGHDLWSSLEQRLKKQDERILDVMGRLEVIQARVMTSAASQPQPASSLPVTATTIPPPPSQEETVVAPERNPSAQQPASHESQTSQVQAPAPPSPPGELELDETQLAAMRLISENPKNTRELTDALKKSREHTARIMKELFEMGFVSRNNASKPFVYQITDEGRRRLSLGSP